MQRLTIVALMFLLIVGCSQETEFENMESTEFTRAAVQPDWFNRTKAVSISNYADMHELWRSHKRCCDDDRGVTKANRVFYKSCYRAIQHGSDDPNLEPYCLWLMDVALDYEQSTQISKYLLKRHAQFRQRTDNCANCSTGDLVARVTKDVANFEFHRQSNHSDAIGMLNDLLIERGSEITFWVLGEIYEDMANMLVAMPYDETATARLSARIDQLILSWPSENTQQWRLDDLTDALTQLSNARFADE